MDNEVVVETIGALGRIRLNRPKALNSLTLGMFHGVDAALERFAADDAIGCVAISGEGDRAFCAGGDLLGFYDADEALAEALFRAEYRLDAHIGAYPKPLVALMDRIVMGGGVGVSAHASHRVVTERSRVAMPETGIGLFPDVGASWLLPRAPGETGTWLGLAGETIGAADAIYAGLADRMVASASVSALIDALAGLSPDAGHDGVRGAVDAFAEPPGAPPLEALRPTIDACFSFDRVEDILAALEADGSDFAASTRALLSSRSPTSLVATLALLRLGRDAVSLEECLERDYRMGLALFAEHDFREGIRAALVDKDRAPRWDPPTLGAIAPGKARQWLAPRAAPLFAPEPA